MATTRSPRAMPAAPLALLFTALALAAGASNSFAPESRTILEASWSDICGEGESCGLLTAFDIRELYDVVIIEVRIPEGANSSTVDIVPSSLNLLFCASPLPECGSAAASGIYSASLDSFDATVVTSKVPLFVLGDWRDLRDRDTAHADRIAMVDTPLSVKFLQRGGHVYVSASLFDLNKASNAAIDLLEPVQIHDDGSVFLSVGLYVTF